MNPQDDYGDIKPVDGRKQLITLEECDKMNKHLIDIVKYKENLINELQATIDIKNQFIQKLESIIKTKEGVIQVLADKAVSLQSQLEQRNESFD